MTTVDEYLRNIDYREPWDYIPSDFALEFITFIKLVNGGDGEENKSPLLHFKMLDVIAKNENRIANMVHRGSAKTTLFAEYLILYLSVYTKLPYLGKVELGIYVGDSIDNGVKNLRKNLEHRWENSDFLREYVPEVKLTDVRWEFTNKSGDKLIFKGYGAKTGVRGVKEMGKRPSLALLDDLVSDEDARSPTVISTIEDTIYKAVTYALHPKKNKIIWNGTPFNSGDPLYKAVESAAWASNVFPVCEEFPVPKEDFRSSWPDRFTYEYVKEQYDIALAIGKVFTFNQELMLRIMSDEDRVILDEDILWYSRGNLLKNQGAFNFYITTDFATSEKQSSDYSVISVWALNNNGDWYWVDGICKRQLMNKNVDDLFRLVQQYKPMSVGIEISGQQKGFISWIQGEMMTRNIFFTLASDTNENQPGIRPVKNKMERFNIVLPWIKAHKMYFPSEMKEGFVMMECIEELSLVSVNGFKSKHDDFIDTISMLGSIKAWKPSESVNMHYNDRTNIWEVDDMDEETRRVDSYII